MLTDLSLIYLLRLLVQFSFGRQLYHFQQLVLQKRSYYLVTWYEDVERVLRDFYFIFADNLHHQSSNGQKAIVLNFKIRHDGHQYGWLSLSLLSPAHSEAPPAPTSSASLTCEFLALRTFRRVILVNYLVEEALFWSVDLMASSLVVLVVTDADLLIFVVAAVDMPR